VMSETLANELTTDAFPSLYCAYVVPQSLWHYDTLTLPYMTSQQNIQSPPS
jgi:hypothetical protein